MRFMNQKRKENKMRKIKSIVFHQGYEQYKMTIGKLFITIRKTMAVTRSEFDARWLRERFYDVRKEGDLIFFKGQAFLMLNIAQSMKSTLIEKDGRFYLSKDGVLDENMRIHALAPDEEDPQFESIVKVENGLSVTISNGMRNIYARNRKKKKLHKRVFMDAVMEGKHWMRLQQFMIVNAYLMRAILDLLERDGETGYYFDLSKVKQKID